MVQQPRPCPPANQSGGLLLSNPFSLYNRKHSETLKQTVASGKTLPAEGILFFSSVSARVTSLNFKWTTNQKMVPDEPLAGGLGLLIQHHLDQLLVVVPVVDGLQAPERVRGHAVPTPGLHPLHDLPRSPARVQTQTYCNEVERRFKQTSHSSKLSSIETGSGIYFLPF